MQIMESIKNMLGYFVTSNYTELPERIKTGIEKYIGPDEAILLTLRNYRAIYRAPRWIDSNTFFNSWMVLTDSRIIIARNSSKFKRFRDIPLTEITQIFYELDQDEPRLTITSPGKEDVIQFTRGGAPYCKGLDTKINAAMATAKEKKKHAVDDTSVTCNKCGSKVPAESKYCPECGARMGSF